MYNNIKQENNFIKNRGERTYIIYINTIGSYSDKYMYI